MHAHINLQNGLRNIIISSWARMYAKLGLQLAIFIIRDLRLDWGVRGFWEFQREALFDIRIINADAPSYSTSTTQSLFDNARIEKKNKYGLVVEDRRACFTPILATCEGIFDHEAIVYMKRLATLLATKWSKNYSQIYGWLKARMQVCILRSVSLCLRGSRTQWRGAGIEDGAQIPTFATMN